jgi:hypothetical protein
MAIGMSLEDPNIGLSVSTKQFRRLSRSKTDRNMNALGPTIVKSDHDVLPFLMLYFSKSQNAWRMVRYYYQSPT